MFRYTQSILKAEMSSLVFAKDSFSSVLVFAIDLTSLLI